MAPSLESRTWAEERRTRWTVVRPTARTFGGRRAQRLGQLRPRGCSRARDEQLHAGYEEPCHRLMVFYPELLHRRIGLRDARGAARSAHQLPVAATSSGGVKEHVGRRQGIVRPGELRERAGAIAAKGVNPSPKRAFERVSPGAVDAAQRIGIRFGTRDELTRKSRGGGGRGGGGNGTAPALIEHHDPDRFDLEQERALDRLRARTNSLEPPKRRPYIHVELERRRELVIMLNVKDALW